MILTPEEKSSRGPLIAFIDLLFLLVAFFTLLLFFVQQRTELSQQQMEAVQEQVARITGQQLNVPEMLETLEQVADRLVGTREQQAERERLLTERQRRRAQRGTVRLEYVLAASGLIEYKGSTYSAEQFLQRVVTPLREKSWVALRAFAAPATPFGAVVEHRQLLLRDSNEFDTYWDNVTRSEPAAPER
jgi:hypothetical protein